MTKIAVLADLHLPDNPDTVKDDAFEWALSTAVQQQADIIVAAGDLTSIGTSIAAERVKKKLEGTGLPFLIVPGNSEYRTPSMTQAVLEKLKTQVLFEYNHCHILGLDNSRMRLTDDSRLLLKKLARKGIKNVVAAAHFPLDALPEKDNKLLTELFESGCIALFVAGHAHIDACEHIAEGEYHLLRGIDPDKAIGGPPSLTFFEQDSDHGRWQRSDVPFPAGSALTWTDQQREVFRNLLGISCMDDSLGGIAEAIQHQIQCLEIRFNCANNLPREKLCSLIRRWRNEGGQHLSIHFPDIRWDSKAGMVKGTEEVKMACELALACEADRLTIHVPRCTAGIITENIEVKTRLLDTCAALLEPVLNKGVTVGIENLHMTPEEKPGAYRGFGYTPAECLDWIYALRKKTGHETIGFHFDIGHARNNVPYSSLYNISQWFAATGMMITGYHLHQVQLNAEGQYQNHLPVTGLFGPLISFSSLFAAWSKGQIRHAPMYLEIREGSSLESLQVFRKYLMST